MLFSLVGSQGFGNVGTAIAVVLLIIHCYMISLLTSGVRSKRRCSIPALRWPYLNPLRGVCCHSGLEVRDLAVDVLIGVKRILYITGGFWNRSGIDRFDVSVALIAQSTL
jgi:hypothetical protein